jgi:hypothetical protein
MRVYGHLQVEHSLAMSKRVNFEKPTNVIKMPKPVETKIGPPSVSSKGIGPINANEM